MRKFILLLKLLLARFLSLFIGKKEETEESESESELETDSEVDSELSEENLDGENNSDETEGLDPEADSDSGTESVDETVADEERIADAGEASSLTDPKTDFRNAKVLAALWKPKRDHGHEAVVVFWSDNISYKDLVLEVLNPKGQQIKVLGKKDFVPASYYVRGHNVHGKYGGINFALPVSSNQLPKKLMLKAKVKSPATGKVKYVKIFKFDSITVSDPNKRVEVNYKTNNYKG
jgi:hypothetical protein